MRWKNYNCQTTRKQLNAEYINLTDYAKTNNLTLGEDKERKTTIIDEEKMRKKLTETINQHKTPTSSSMDTTQPQSPQHNLSTHVFVLRRNPKELKEFMQKCGFSEAKLNENLSAEILDICLIEAIETQEGKVCELDVTGKTVDENVD